MSSRPDLDGAPLAVEMIYPGDYWDQDYDEEDEYVEAVSQFSDADVCGVVDSDADGLGCELFIREAFPDSEVGVVQAGQRTDIEIPDAVAMAAEHSNDGAQLIMADLCPDEEDIDDLVFSLGAFEDATVIDHHDWSEESINAVKSEAKLVHETTKCATQLVRDEFFENPPDHLDEFADVTADHDLWIKDDPRSKDLSDFQFWSDKDEYLDRVKEFGPDIIEDPEVQSFLEENRIEKEERIRLSIEGADKNAEKFDDWDVVQTGATWIDVEFESTDITVNRDWFEENLDAEPPDDCLCEDGERVTMTIEGPLSVAFIYGEMYSSGAGQAAQEAGADVAVIIPPYNKVSIRTRDETPIAATVAQEMGGGGHPSAAGARPNVAGRYNEISYSQHWATKGVQAKKKVLDAIESVVLDS